MTSTPLFIERLPTLLSRSTSLRLHRTLLAAAGVALLSVVPASATTYTTSLPGSSLGPYGLNASQQLGVSFETGSNLEGYEINSVTLALNLASDEGSLLTPTLFATSAGLPSGAALFSDFTLTTAGTGINNYTFTANSSFILDPNTSYALVLVPGAISLGHGWYYTVDASTNIGGWSMANNLLASMDGGSTWSAPAGATVKTAINATAVPEPSALIFLGVAGVTAVALRRRRSA